MTSREQFEAWWERELYDHKLSKVKGIMFNRIKANMFIAWQASRNEVQIDLPKEMGEYQTAMEGDGWNLMRRHAVKAIESVGLKVKEY
ncbi:TPA: hypothetical protein MI729_000886 [Klebsiella aerogenes]|nr:hypothetical protein [Klebsiella aerogenes]